MQEEKTSDEKEIGAGVDARANNNVERSTTPGKDESNRNELTMKKLKPGKQRSLDYSAIRGKILLTLGLPRGWRILSQAIDISSTGCERCSRLNVGLEKRPHVETQNWCPSRGLFRL
jgi:hypothetical protein